MIINGTAYVDLQGNITNVGYMWLASCAANEEEWKHLGAIVLWFGRNDRVLVDGILIDMNDSEDLLEVHDPTVTHDCAECIGLINGMM